MINTERMIQYLIDSEEIAKWSLQPYGSNDKLAKAMCSHYSRQLKSDNITDYFLLNALIHDINWHKVATEVIYYGR